MPNNNNVKPALSNVNPTPASKAPKAPAATCPIGEAMAPSVAVWDREYDSRATEVIADLARTAKLAAKAADRDFQRELESRARFGDRATRFSAAIEARKAKPSVPDGNGNA